MVTLCIDIGSMISDGGNSPSRGRCEGTSGGTDSLMMSVTNTLPDFSSLAESV